MLTIPYIKICQALFPTGPRVVLYFVSYLRIVAHVLEQAIDSTGAGAEVIAFLQGIAHGLWQVPSSVIASFPHGMHFIPTFKIFSWSLDWDLEILAVVET
jgi:hypothetical protein